MCGERERITVILTGGLVLMGDKQPVYEGSFLKSVQTLFRMGVKQVENSEKVWNTNDIM